MRSTARPVLALYLAAGIVACAPHAKPAVTPRAPIAALPVTAPTAVETPGREIQVRPDPAAGIVARAQDEFNAGERELQDGHMVAARQHFDAAIDSLLALPTGARSDPVVSAAFDQLLDRISALEVIALREGDGLTESTSEPAALDVLLNAATFERPQPAATTAETVKSDLERTAHDLNIPANDRVLSFIELFQGRLHDFMSAGLERSTRYVPMIQQVFREEGLPEDLAFVPLVESAFKPNALSRASAKGMWQFMLTTGHEHGLQQSFFVDERSDPEKATRAAAKYLKSLRDAFDGDWNMALASYNAGPGRIQRAAQRARTGDYWSLTASTRYLPRETCDYVPMIMAAVLIARNPGLYGFDVTPSHPLAFEHVVVPNALDLKYIAEWSGVTVDDIRALNPELRRTTTPNKPHTLKVPAGTAVTVERQLASADALFVRFDFLTVRRGDTLASVARRYRISQAELREANDLTGRARVAVGQTLMIPQHQPVGLPSPTSRTARATVSAPAPRPAAPVTYRVQAGDTLFSIARRFDTTVDSLKQLNKLRTNAIGVGDRLTVRR